MEIQIGDSADRVCRGLTGLLLCYLGIILLVGFVPTAGQLCVWLPFLAILHLPLSRC
jgi:hypothetical protein